MLVTSVIPYIELMHQMSTSKLSCATETHVTAVTTKPIRPAIDLPMCLMMEQACFYVQVANTPLYLSTAAKQCTKNITIIPDVSCTPIIRFHNVDNRAVVLRNVRSSQSVASIPLTQSHIST